MSGAWVRNCLQRIPKPINVRHTTRIVRSLFVIVYDFMLKIDFDIKSSLLNCKVCGEFKECDYRKCKHIYALIIKQNGLIWDII